jgi:hypothetical protein
VLPKKKKKALELHGGTHLKSQEDPEFQVSLGYIIRSCLKTIHNKKKRKRERKRKNALGLCFLFTGRVHARCEQGLGFTLSSTKSSHKEKYIFLRNPKQSL